MNNLQNRQRKPPKRVTVKSTVRDGTDTVITALHTLKNISLFLKCTHFQSYLHTFYFGSLKLESLDLDRKK